MLRVGTVRPRGADGYAIAWDPHAHLSTSGMSGSIRAHAMEALVSKETRW